MQPLKTSVVSIFSLLLVAFILAGNGLAASVCVTTPKSIEARKVPQVRKTELQTGSDYYAPSQAGIRHIEPNGIGYSKGYTTFDVFLTSLRLNQECAVFLDLRSQIFDDSLLAANVGLGMRYLGPWILGVNIYYDYRQTIYLNYNQIGVGLECLGKYLDFRLNGYFSIGTRESSYYDPEFSYFQNNYLYISEKRDFAFSSANAEFGLSINYFKNAPIYLALGPYFLSGNVQTACGQALRASISLREYLKLQISESYDHIFKWLGQVQLALSIPLGRKTKVKTSNKRSYTEEGTFLKKASSPVSRNEVIPVDTESNVTKAINPDTEEPYFFLFVNNSKESGEGTYENPYGDLPSLETTYSENNVIYLSGENGVYTTGYEALTGQYIFSSGIVQCLPLPGDLTIEIPSLDSGGIPILTNSPGFTALTFASNVVVSGIGIIVPADGIGISATGVNDGLIREGSFSFAGDNSIAVAMFETTDFSIERSRFSLNFSGNRGIEAIKTKNSTIDRSRFVEVDGATSYTGIYSEQSLTSFQTMRCDFTLQSSTGTGIITVDNTPGLDYSITNCSFHSRVKGENSEGRGVVLGDGITSVGGENLYLQENSFVDIGSSIEGGPVFTLSSLAYEALYFNYNQFVHCQTIAHFGSSAMVFFSIEDDNISRFFAAINRNVFRDSVDTSYISFELSDLGTSTKARCIELQRNISDAEPIAYQIDCFDSSLIDLNIEDNVGNTYINTEPISH
ncbi:MAG: inverse autotransporter beta domain-containing protein [Verrucomicrobia bacterium]|nr:inverse autotransporter beta domain-containing protein [Verrucomicrobiota bacterium]